MNTNRLINMIVQLVLRKGLARLSRGQTGKHSRAAREMAKRVRQTGRLTRRF